MTEEEWIEYLKRSRTWSIRMSHELLHSRAYEELNYAAALKVLNWFHEKIEIEVIKTKRGKNRYRIVNDGQIEFSYKEAGFRGLTSHRFRNALMELHRVGFIDIKKPGSALKDDHTVFSLSDRWRDYGTPNFKAEEFPRSPLWQNFGFKPKQKLDVETDT